ncbi:MAG: cyclic nucleotide-binding domain-containing protein [Acidimicrobiia bacterium]|nr:cyclic nucleotide-binding domain-containing protein [Acidimicrobiia bacterium]
MIDLVAELERQPFLEGLSEEHLRFLSSLVDRRSFGEGEILFRQDDPAIDFYLVAEGRVALEVDRPDGSSITVQTLKPGNLLGISWLYPPHRWQFTTRAVAPTVVFRFDGDSLRAACDDDHSLGYELLGLFVVALGSRLQATRFQLLDMYRAESRSDR